MTDRRRDGPTNQQTDRRRVNRDGTSNKFRIYSTRYKNIDPKMIEQIMNEIMDTGSPVNWDDIAGLAFQKETVKEIVVLPMLRPDIFTGIRYLIYLYRHQVPYISLLATGLDLIKM